jgi:sulfide:quinone oxidoreductase
VSCLRFRDGILGDYTMEPKPSFPLIDTTKERKDMWLIKRHGLPALYWNLMLQGRA